MTVETNSNLKNLYHNITIRGIGSVKIKQEDREKHDDIYALTLTLSNKSGA